MSQEPQREPPLWTRDPNVQQNLQKIRQTYIVNLINAMKPFREDQRKPFTAKALELERSILLHSKTLEDYKSGITSKTCYIRRSKQSNSTLDVSIEHQRRQQEEYRLVQSMFQKFKANYELSLQALLRQQTFTFEGIQEDDVILGQTIKTQLEALIKYFSLGPESKEDHMNNESTYHSLRDNLNLFTIRRNRKKIEIEQYRQKEQILKLKSAINDVLVVSKAAASVSQKVSQKACQIANNLLLSHLGYPSIEEKEGDTLMNMLRVNLKRRSTSLNRTGNENMRMDSFRMSSKWNGTWINPNPEPNVTSEERSWFPGYGLHSST